MRIAKVSSLKGGEIVAKNITLDNEIILISKNTILKKEYIKKIQELGFESIYVKKNNNIKIKKSSFLDNNIKDDLKEKVKETLEEHMYKNILKLDNLIFVANEVINTIENKIFQEEVSYEIVGHNADLYEHTMQVCLMAVAVAVKMKLDKNTIYQIGLASLLHDIGLRYITVNYRNCKLDELTPNEIFEYKKHTIYGYIALEDIPEIDIEIKNLVLFHHEKMDGSGFPLKQKNLNICQRILTACDAFECNISGMGCIRKKRKETIYLLEGSSESLYDKHVIQLIKELFCP